MSRVDNLVNMLDAYVADGGYHLNVNVFDRETLLEREPNLSDNVTGALYASSAAIVNPWRLCLGMAETAAKNGVEFYLDSEVTAIEKINGAFRVTAGGKEYERGQENQARELFHHRIILSVLGS